MEYLTVQQSILPLAIIANFTIASYVLAKDRRNIVNKSFFTSILGATIWILGIFLIAQTRNFILFDKLALYGSAIMIFGFVLFAKVFPRGSIQNTKFWLIFIPLIIVILLIPFNLIIEDAVIHPDKSLEPINGPAFPFFAATYGFYMLYSIYLLRKTYKNSKSSERMRMQYFFLGFGSFITISLISDVILPAFNIFSLNLLGPASSIILVVATAYSIVRHQLMDIRVIIQKGLIYTALLTMIVLLYLGLISLFSSILRQTISISATLSAGLTTVIGIFSVPLIDRHLRKITDRFFFKDKYIYSEAIHHLSKILNRNISLEKILIESAKKIKEIIKVDRVSFIIIPQNMVFNEKGKSKNLKLFRPKKFLKARAEYPHALIHSEIPHMVKDITADPDLREMLKKIREYGIKNGIALSVPIILDKKILGILGLSQKLSGDSYTKRDVNLIETFSSQAAVALEKARLYEEVKNYSEILEEKVKERTGQIKNLQEKQRQTMLEISHGLQTPLTSFKNKLSTLKLKKIGSKELKFFERTIDETSDFIYKLLNLAQIETTTDDFEKTKVDLSSLLIDLIEYFEIVALDKNIKLKSKIEKGIIILGNKKRLEELMTNLVSNSIKYIRDDKREINIGLRALKDKAVITVEDTGTGIPKKELPNIFENFYRGKEKEPSIKGSGLGLSIVKKIVDRHKGKIKTDSQENKGTKFIITFERFT